MVSGKHITTVSFEVYSLRLSLKLTWHRANLTVERPAWDYSNFCREMYVRNSTGKFHSSHL
jgi:hypothetical protein